MTSLLRTYWSDFVDLLFPRCCEACEGELLGNESLICTACRIGLPRVESDSTLQSTLFYKFSGIRQVSGVFAFLVFTKKGKVQNLLHALKYKKQRDVGVLLGTMMAQEMASRNQFPLADFIVSVPLHKRRQQERGYNQSDAFAEGISKVTGIPWSGIVMQRTRYTKSQTGKSKAERRENVRGIFELTADVQIKGKRIILVDDVLTTGATLEACLEILIGAGCNDIYIMTIAAAQ